ncbi:hypothetical protein BJ170DRAFT_110592 [Xylariales sp. AK1849]|nr:hypothetical protein BJ170DRAFT_110592 [Xylariales sp. AK1849]
MELNFAVLILVAFLAASSKAMLEEGTAYCGDVNVSDLGEGWSEAFRFTKANNSEGDIGARIAVADNLVKGSDQIVSAALMSLTRTPFGGGFDELSIINLIIENETLQEAGKNDPGDCSSIFSDQCIDDLLQTASWWDASYSTGELPQTCPVIDAVYGITTQTTYYNFSRSDGFFAYEGRPHDKGNETASKEMENAIFPFIQSVRTHNTGQDGQNQTGYTGASQLNCLRAANRSTSTSSTTTTTAPTSSSTASVGPILTVNTETLLGMAAVIAVWGLC